MIDPNALPLPDLYEHLSRSGCVRRLFELARDEDLGEAGDITTRLCAPPTPRCRADLVAHEPCVVAGLAAVEDILDVFAPTTVFRPGVADGDTVGSGAVVGRLMGPTPEILAVERTVLNTLGRLCGVATRTASFVRAVQGTRATICDTRKTTPGLRMLEKYAVRCGGGTLHRLGLSDAVLIKDNHIAGLSAPDAREAIAAAVRAAWPMRARPGIRFVEVEADSLDLFRLLLTIEQGAIDIILLDNMSPEQLAQAVALRDHARAQVLLEASGGVTLDNVRGIAATGVDRISVGALTHHAPWIDLGLDIAGAVE